MILEELGIGHLFEITTFNHNISLQHYVFGYLMMRLQNSTFGHGTKLRQSSHQHTFQPETEKATLPTHCNGKMRCMVNVRDFVKTEI